MHRIFVGPNGLRSGWSFLLYVAMVFALGALLTRVISRVPAGVRHHTWFGVIGELIAFGIALVPSLVMGRIEHRTLADYGLPRRRAFGKLFWDGALWGLLSLTVLMAAMRAVGVFYYGQVVLHGIDILKFAAYYAVFFVIVGLFEEYLMRGYSLYTLSRGMGFWPSAALLSAAFGAIHLGNKGEGWVGALAAALIGFFFCLTLRRTGTLWFAIGFHASWDWGETYLYSVPNSGTTAPGHLTNSSFHGPAWLTGGTVGPEGSALVFVLLVLLWLAFDRAYRGVLYPANEAGERNRPASPVTGDTAPPGLTSP